LYAVQKQLFSCVKSCNKYWSFASAPTFTVLYKDALGDRNTATQPNLTVKTFHFSIAEDDGGYQLHTGGRNMFFVQLSVSLVFRYTHKQNFRPSCFLPLT